MKKYIYSAVFVAVMAAVAIFFFRSPETGDWPRPMTLAITFRFPENYEFTEGAPFMLTWRAEDPGGSFSVPVAAENFNPLISPYELVFLPPPGSVAVLLNSRLYYCQKTSRMCFQDDFEARIPLDPDSSQARSWVWEIVPKKV